MFISISFESQGLKNVPLLSALTASSMNLSISSMRHSISSLQSSQASCKAVMALIMPLEAPLFVCEAMYSGRILHTLSFMYSAAALSASSSVPIATSCLLYTSDAADEEDSVDLGGRRIIKKKK